MEKTILLVEDNPDDADLTQRAFRKVDFGNRIRWVQDGAEALEYLLGEGPDAPPLPEIVLLDLNLPKLDGIEVLRRIRANSRTQLLPVIILTSSSEQQDMVDCYKLGANSYVQKPVSFADFLEAAKQLGLYWLVINQTAPALEKG